MRHRSLLLALQVRSMSALASTPCGELACQKDSYAKSLRTTVMSCERAAAPAPAKKGKKKAPPADVFRVVLADTVLFPEGGGQPSDTGSVGGVAVARVDNVDGVAVHSLAGPVEVGAEVDVLLDWDRRWDHACQHTGQHLVTALAVDAYGAPTLSWTLGAASSFLELGAPFDADAHLAELEAAVNAAILDGAPVAAEWHPVAAVNGGTVPGLRPSSKALPDSVTGPVRVVRLGAVDVNTCCGTHVTTLAHLQCLKFTKVEKKKASTLVHFVAGPRVRATLGGCLARERDLCLALSAGPDLVVQRLDDALRSKAESERRARQLTKDLVDLKVAALRAERATGARVLRSHRDAPADMAELGKLLASAFDDACPGCVLLQTFGEGTKDGAYLISAADAGLVDKAKEPIMAALEGKGGGKGGRSQGKCANLAGADAAVAAAADALGA